MKLDFVNQTVLEQYLHCPHLFKMRKLGYEHKKKAKVGEIMPVEKWNEAMLIGKAIHAVLPIYLEKGVNSALRKLVTLLPNVKLYEEAAEMVEKLPNYIPKEGVTAERQVGFRTRGIPECRTNFDFFLQKKDLIRIYEIKTGWRLQTIKQVEESIEARWYAFMLNYCFPDETKEYRYIFLRYDTAFNVEPEPLDIFYVGEICTQIEQDKEFLPNRSYCPFCEYITHCKLGISYETPTDIAGLYLHHKAKADAYLELLKKWKEDIRLGHWHFYWAKVKRRDIKDEWEFFNFLLEKIRYFKPEMEFLRKNHRKILEEAVEKGLITESEYLKFLVVQTKGE